jgi:hypothetical protein
MVMSHLFRGNNPDFFIIGAQKAGTSSLHHYLGQHPELSPSFPKETHYFDTHTYFGKGMEWYRKHFIRSKPSQHLFFESTPNYIYHEEVAQQISDLYPDSKLIVVLREPISRAYSAWNMYRDMVLKGKIQPLMKGPKPGLPSPIYTYLIENRREFPSFEEAINIEMKLIEEGLEIEPSLLRRGLYEQQLKKYLKYFRRDQILILGFQDLTQSLQKTIDKVCEFLEVKTISVEQLSLEMQNKRKYKDKMGEEVAAQLKDYYKEDNDRLFELLGYQPNW